MRPVSISVVAALASLQSVYAQNAIAKGNNPPGSAYIAAVNGANGRSVRGGIIVSNAEDQGVQFAINFWDLPAEGGPFLYHIHTGPVPDNGNCTATGAHLDPYGRGDSTPCNSANPQSCQVGDLSGKYGTMNNGTVFSASYTDPYVSLVPGDPAFFGNRSFVIHYANATRYACANFIAPQKFIGEGFGRGAGSGDGNGPRSQGGDRTTRRGPTSGFFGSFPTDFPSGGFGGGFGGIGRPAVTSLEANNGNNPAMSSFLSSIGYSDVETVTATVTQQVSITAANAAVTVTGGANMTPLNSPVETDSSDLPPLPGTVTAVGFKANVTSTMEFATSVLGTATQGLVVQTGAAPQVSVNLLSSLVVVALSLVLAF